MTNKKLVSAVVSCVLLSVLCLSAWSYTEARHKEWAAMVKDLQTLVLATTNYAVAHQGTFPQKSKWWESVFENQPQLKRRLSSQEFPTRTVGGVRYTFTLNSALRGRRATQDTPVANILMLYISSGSNSGWGNPQANNVVFPQLPAFKKKVRFVGMAGGGLREFNSDQALEAIIASSKSEEVVLPKINNSTNKKRR